ncbi:MAG TPA: hypothetical protein VKB80_15160 [Kofleriaceae bacterium]|nr:hypothetical protein [Kofleriaceae bacterium]
MPHEDGGDPDAPAQGAWITLLYVRPRREGLTELDRRVGAIAERYARWVELVVLAPEDAAGRAGLEGVASFGSPALLLLRGGEVVGEAMGALLPARELEQVVRRAVEWPAPL